MKRILKYIFLIFIVSLSLIFFINKISPKFIDNKTSYEIRENISNKERVIFLPLLNFDGRNYFDLADRGYFHIDNWWKKAFYPMYPAMIRIVTNLTGIKLIYSGLVISWISILLGFFYLYKLVKLDYGESIAMKALILVAAFPTSFYFYTYYTESLFFLLSVLCFYNIRLKNYYVASIIAALASATRVVGILFFAYLFYTGVKGYISRNKIPFYILVAPLGLIIFMMFFYLNGDNPLAMFSGQEYWQRHPGLFEFFNTFFESIKKVFIGPRYLNVGLIGYSVIIFELISYLFMIIFLFFSYKKISIDYWIYCLFSFIVPTSTGLLAALPRYMLVLFPIQIFFAKYLKKRWYYLLLVIYIALLLYFETLFIRGYWVA